jgi:hypothetical protein
VPIQVKFLGNILDAGGTAPTSHVKGEPFGIKRAIQKERKSLRFYLPALLAFDSTDFQLQVDPEGAAGKVPDSVYLLVVVGPVNCPARSAYRFFPWRTRVMMRARGSAKTPRSFRRVRNPGKRYASSSLLILAIPEKYQFPDGYKLYQTPVK